MDDTPFPGVLDRVADPGQEFQALETVEMFFLRVAGDAASGNKFHGEVRLGALGPLVGASLVALRDAGMLETSQNLDLTLEAGKKTWTGPFGPNHLESHKAAGPVLLRQIDHSHSAAAQLGEDPEPLHDEPGRRRPGGIGNHLAEALLPFQEAGRLLLVAKQGKYVRR